MVGYGNIHWAALEDRWQDMKMEPRWSYEGGQVELGMDCNYGVDGGHYRCPEA